MMNKTNFSRTVHEYRDSLLILYDCKSGKFTYPPRSAAWADICLDERPLWQILEEDNLGDMETARDLQRKILEMASAAAPQAYFTEYYIPEKGAEGKWYRVGFVCAVPGTVITITVTDIDEEIMVNRHMKKMAERDELTGLLNRSTFCRKVDARMQSDVRSIDAGDYAMVYLDILRFKAINDMFGMAAGDRVLVHIADVLARYVKPEDDICRLGADQFAVFTHTSGDALGLFAETILRDIQEYDLPVEITCNIGIYVTDQERLEAQLMIDRATLAQASVRDNYNVRICYYTESLRSEMLSEQEIVGIMASALADNQFAVYYQPQYNHTTGMLIGAEALVRWKHPERGLISPGVFIPIFEKNGFITRLDMFVFGQCCRFLRKCMDRGLPLIPVSANFSRRDIFQSDFVEKLEQIRKQYEVPAKYLRVEITESVVVGGSQFVNEIVRKLHHYGYIVEMDDFGSGYSSLNVLKDLELDIIKLDMLFLSRESENNRGGTILSSVVRMARWLNMPVIAEGVETIQQADFLRSIGCDYIQGYLYSRPLPEADYEALLHKSRTEKAVPHMDMIEPMNGVDFWNPQSQETLIFSNYVGGAAIFEYHGGQIEMLRLNEKYLQELCLNLTEREVIQSEFLAVFDEQNKQIYLDMLEKAIETADEQECETWRTFVSSGCGDENICIRSNVRMIGRNGDSYLFYGMIRNITAERTHYSSILDSERRFKMACEQINIYYWEYTVATKEMRPCFRCMRDLGLPALVTDYPEPAIEMGIFPPEVADMYRDWHRQIAEGVKELEAVIPLTADRVPFRVRYTTEFDDNGTPVKAYGSAVLVV